MKYQIDTDILCYLLKGDAALAERFIPHLIAEGTLHLSVVTVYEVKKGLYHINSVSKLKAFDALLEDCIVHPLTVEIATQAAEIKGALMQRGQGIDHIDLLIGTTALYLGYTIVTNNESHFSVIPGLYIENWTK